MRKHRATVTPIEPEFTSREGGAQIFNVSPRGFDTLRARGVVRAIKIPGMRRNVYSIAELRAVAESWKNQHEA